MQCPRCLGTDTGFVGYSFDDGRCWENWHCDFCGKDFSDTISCDETEVNENEDQWPAGLYNASGGRR